ncbi:MAG: phosphoglycerate kinase [Acidimicrobiia bacterium]
MTDFLTLDEVDPSGMRVLVRSDLNVPLDGLTITDDFRIRAALPTIALLRDAGATVVVCSHLGRPKGVDPAFSMAPISARMSELGGFPVTQLDGVVSPEVEAAVAAAQPGSVLLLQNTRYEPGETKNDDALSDGLAALCDLFVQDAFGSVHRAHSSTVGVAERVRSVAGPLLAAEVVSLGTFLGEPERPYVVILGGAKVSDKLAVIENLLPRVDSMLIGGGMCFTLLAAQGVEVGASLVEEEMVTKVGELLASEHGSKIVLPTDLVAAVRFSEDAEHRAVAADSIPAGWMGLDIGPETADGFSAIIRSARTVFWNGPMGVFEWDAFRAGTETVARAMSETGAFTAVGGGDSAAALRLLGFEAQVSHLSTGGGAGLEMLEGKELPGVAVLARWAR